MHETETSESSEYLLVTSLTDGESTRDRESVYMFTGCSGHVCTYFSLLPPLFLCLVVCLSVLFSFPHSFSLSVCAPVTQWRGRIDKKIHVALTATGVGESLCMPSYDIVLS